MFDLRWDRNGGKVSHRQEPNAPRKTTIILVIFLALLTAAIIGLFFYGYLNNFFSGG